MTLQTPKPERSTVTDLFVSTIKQIHRIVEGKVHQLSFLGNVTFMVTSLESSYRSSVLVPRLLGLGEAG